MTSIVTTGNRQLAARARDLAARAPSGSAERKTALVAAVALDETRTVAAARGVLRMLDYPGQASIRRAALDLLGQLAGEEG